MWAPLVQGCLHISVFGATGCDSYMSEDGKAGQGKDILPIPHHVFELSLAAPTPT